MKNVIEKILKKIFVAAYFIFKVILYLDKVFLENKIQFAVKWVFNILKNFWDKLFSGWTTEDFKIHILCIIFVSKYIHTTWEIWEWEWLYLKNGCYFIFQYIKDWFKK